MPELVSALVEAGASAGRRSSRSARWRRRGAGLPRVGAWAAIERERIRLSRYPETFDVPAAIAVAEQATRTLGALGDELGLGAPST